MTQHDEQLQRYFDEEMPAGERAAFELTLTDSDRERLAALAEVRAVLNNALDADAAHFDIWPSIEAAVSVKRRSPARRRRSSRVLGASAGFLAAAAAAFFFLLRPVSAPQPRARAVIERLDVQGSAVAVLSVGDDETPLIWTTEEDD